MSTTVDTTMTGSVTTDTTTVDTTMTGSVTTDTTTVDTTANGDTTMVNPTGDTTADTTTDTTAVAPEPTMTFEEIGYLILTRACANVICHTGPPYVDPILSDARNTLYDTLMTWTVEECDGKPLVTPGDPDNSAIVMVVRHECEPFVIESTGEVFDAMPPGCVDPVCLHPDDYDALVAWISAGAKE